MQATYSSLIGQDVTFQVVTGEISVPVSGVLLSEAPQTIRLRIGGTWDLDIYKNMIQKVVKQDWVSSIT